MLNAINADNSPVTYSVRWLIKPGFEAEFEPLLSQIIHAAMPRMTRLFAHWL